MKTKKEELEKEIETELSIFNQLGTEVRNRLVKDFERVTRGERLFIIEILNTKIEAYKQAKKEQDEKVKKLKGILREMGQEAQKDWEEGNLSQGYRQAIRDSLKEIDKIFGEENDNILSNR